MRNESGVTLVELLVVVSIIGLLIIALGFSYEGWLWNYRIESMTKELYFDLSDARSLAMSHSRIHWAVLDTTQYTIFEDTNPNPEGDGVLDGADNQVLQKQYEYNDYQLALVGGALPQTITFDRRGLISWGPAQNELMFRFINTRDPDLDCIVTEQSKIWMGEYNTDLNICERR
jgi:prepilin-type N-terminal cleavage/methylation domain-containing protein